MVQMGRWCRHWPRAGRQHSACTPQRCSRPVSSKDWGCELRGESPQLCQSNEQRQTDQILAYCTMVELVPFQGHPSPCVLYLALNPQPAPGSAKPMPGPLGTQATLSTPKAGAGVEGEPGSSFVLMLLPQLGSFMYSEVLLSTPPWPPVPPSPACTSFPCLYHLPLLVPPSYSDLGRLWLFLLCPVEFSWWAKRGTQAPGPAGG